MINFLFWNINRKPLEKIISNLTLKHQVDVLVLAECQIPVEIMLSALNQGSAQYYFPYTQCEKITIFTRFSRRFLTPIFETGRWTIRRLKLPERTDILLAAVHLPSKLHWSKESQMFECAQLAGDIIKVEKRVGHARTVLVGDLNINPFEEGVFASAGLNAVMTKNLARRGTRILQSRKYPFFYNPMWGNFGDQTEGPPGTYYYERAEHATLFWNIFDQVLVRPDLIDRFCDTELKILSGDENVSLLSANGLPDANIASDHLPIVFSLDL